MVWPLLRCRREAVPPLKYPWLPASCVPLRYILNAWSREGELSKEIFLFKKKKIPSTIVWGNKRHSFMYFGRLHFFSSRVYRINSSLPVSGFHVHAIYVFFIF